MATPRASREFIISATRAAQFPRTALPEFAFLGRSNVGKSSLLNCLAGVDKLAYVSATPGRTQAINFFDVGGSCIFADLPGYGFAKVPKEIQHTWKALIEEYLLSRERLALSFVLLDGRRGWMEKDRELREWLEFQERPYLVVATKVDKLNQSESHRGMAAIRKEIGDRQLVPFSAITGEGTREIWQAITRTITP